MQNQLLRKQAQKKNKQLQSLMNRIKNHKKDKKIHFQQSKEDKPPTVTNDQKIIITINADTTNRQELAAQVTENKQTVIGKIPNISQIESTFLRKQQLMIEDIKTLEKMVAELNIQNYQLSLKGNEVQKQQALISALQSSNKSLRVELQNKDVYYKNVVSQKQAGISDLKQQLEKAQQNIHILQYSERSADKELSDKNLSLQKQLRDIKLYLQNSKLKESPVSHKQSHIQKQINILEVLKGKDTLIEAMEHERNTLNVKLVNFDNKIRLLEKNLVDRQSRQTELVRSMATYRQTITEYQKEIESKSKQFQKLRIQQENRQVTLTKQSQTVENRCQQISKQYSSQAEILIKYKNENQHLKNQIQENKLIILQIKEQVSTFFKEHFTKFQDMYRLIHTRYNSLYDRILHTNGLLFNRIRLSFDNMKKFKIKLQCAQNDIRIQKQTAQRIQQQQDLIIQQKQQLSLQLNDTKNTMQEYQSQLVQMKEKLTNLNYINHKLQQKCCEIQTKYQEADCQLQESNTKYLNMLNEKDQLMSQQQNQTQKYQSYVELNKQLRKILQSKMDNEIKLNNRIQQIENSYVRNLNFIKAQILKYNQEVMLRVQNGLKHIIHSKLQALQSCTSRLCLSVAAYKLSNQNRIRAFATDSKQLIQNYHIAFNYHCETSVSKLETKLNLQHSRFKLINQNLQAVHQMLGKTLIRQNQLTQKVNTSCNKQFQLQKSHSIIIPNSKCLTKDAQIQHQSVDLPIEAPNNLLNNPLISFYDSELKKLMIHKNQLTDQLNLQEIKKAQLQNSIKQLNKKIKSLEETIHANSKRYVENIQCMNEEIKSLKEKNDLLFQQLQNYSIISN